MSCTYILAVDIGSAAVKAVVARRGEALEIIGSGEAPSAGIIKGVLKDADLVAAAVRQAVDCACLAAQVNIVDAHIGISGLDIVGNNSHGCVAAVSPDSVTEGDLDRATQAALITTIDDDRQVMHSIPIYYCLDGKNFFQPPVGSCGTRVEICSHIVSIPRQTVNDLIAALESVGVHISSLVSNMVIGSFAIKAPDSNFLFMDIGSEVTNVATYSDRIITASACFPLGGKYVTQDIMQGLGLTESEAEIMKKAYAKLSEQNMSSSFIVNCQDFGCADKKVEFEFLTRIVESRVEEIAALLAEAIRPQLSHPIERIYLTGGCSNFQSFSTALSRYFELPVQTVEYDVNTEYQDRRFGVCYGIINYVDQNMPPVTVDVPKQQSWFQKVKNLFN